MATATTSQSKKMEYFQRAEKYVKEYRAADRAIIQARRQARNKGNIFVEPEAKLLLVIRIRGVNGVPPKARKVMQLLRLHKMHNGVFVRSSKATLNMLKFAQPWLAWGEPNLKTVRELIYKRGAGKDDHKQIVPLYSNKVVEAALGKYNIICVEDLIHEIVTVGPNFKHANNFLFPFQLSSPKGGFRGIKKHYVDGGDAGDREGYINDLARRMN